VSGSHVTIGEDRILHVNGKPFFPIGARHMPIGATPAVLSAVGFNALRWPAFGTDTAAIPPAEVPDDLGDLMFYPYVYNRADFSEDAGARRELLTELLLNVRDHPALLCYEQRNEPAYTPRNHARSQTPAEGFIAGSRLIRELDPHHPIRVGHMTCNLVSTLRKYNEGVDIVGCNPYVVNHPEMRRFVGTRTDGKTVDTPNQTLSAVGDLTTKMMRVAEGRPVWMQLQAMANEDWYNEEHTPENRGLGIYEHHRLFPSRWQMRFMAFHAIVRGATGLSWALHRVEINSPHWQEVYQVIGELRELHDVLCAPVWPKGLEIEYKELGFSDWIGIETLVKIHRNRPWIIAVNTQFDPMEAVFSHLPPQVSSKLSVFGEDRSLSVHANSFADRFQPYEVHIYAAEE